MGDSSQHNSSDIRTDATLPLRVSSSESSDDSAVPSDKLPVDKVFVDKVPAVQIPGYEVVEEIGRGGMAVVYKARHHGLNRIVALKMVLTGVHASVEEVLRFRIEAEAIACLQHPGIVQIFDVGQHQGCPFYAMEFVEGGTLSEHIARKKHTPVEAAQLICNLAEAIEVAHRRDIVHRDLKPSNILFTADGQPKIADFGVAKRMDDQSAHTATGSVVGTPSYMPPEQAEGRKEVGPAADVYGLGAILYELLTGEPPFRSDSILDVLFRVMTEEPVSPRKRDASVPRDLDTICLKCLEKDPRRRYPSAGALARDLTSSLRGEPIIARPPGLFGRLERWARLHPILACTWVALLFLYLNHLLMMVCGVEGEGGSFHWFVTGLVAVWASAAWGLDRMITRARYLSLGTYIWGTLDVLLVTVLILRSNGPSSALLVAYPVLIAASALRARLDALWLVSILSIVSYGVLILDAAWRRPKLSVPFGTAAIFVLSLLVLALVQHLMLRRSRGANA